MKREKAGLEKIHQELMIADVLRVMTPGTRTLVVRLPAHPRHALDDLMIEILTMTVMGLMTRKPVRLPAGHPRHHRLFQMNHERTGFRAVAIRLCHPTSS